MGFRHRHLGPADGMRNEQVGKVLSISPLTVRTHVKNAMDKLETPIAFKQGAEFQQFFDADARRLAAGVRKVGRVEAK